MEIALAIFHTGNTCICVSGFGPKNRDKIVGFPQLTDIDHQFKNVHKLIFLFVCCLVGMYAVSVRVLRRVVLRGTGHCEREKQSWEQGKMSTRPSGETPVKTSGYWRQSSAAVKMTNSLLTRRSTWRSARWTLCTRRSTTWSWAPPPAPRTTRRRTAPLATCPERSASWAGSGFLNVSLLRTSTASTAPRRPWRCPSGAVTSARSQLCKEWLWLRGGVGMNLDTCTPRGLGRISLVFLQWAATGCHM